MERPFRQVDVFAEAPQAGNPLAVVADGRGLRTEEMQRFAAWTNLSETTFLLPPTSSEADYLVRIFTPVEELPFAGHPTLGTCQVWLDRGGRPRTGGLVVQECEAGLVPIRTNPGGGLAFQAPPLVRSGPVDADTLSEAVRALGLEATAVVDSAWIDNGPGWLGVLLATADEVTAIRPGLSELKIGVIGPHPAGHDAAFELRAFFPGGGSMVEDPVTGSLNASAAQWMTETGRATAPYMTNQGQCVGRDGRIYITSGGDGEIWVGGQVMTTISGTVEL